MRVIFAGTPEFALPSLKAVYETDVEIIAVYTQPDRPVGRGRKLRTSPIKEYALQNHLPIKQPANLQLEHTHIEELQPDLIIVVAYGLIIPSKILGIPKFGCVNVHASLLPRWRGAAPIQRAIEAGDKTTGITLMQMDSGLDSGDILAQTEEPIHTQDTAQSLHDRLATLGAALLRSKLQAIFAGSIVAQPQKENLVTYAAKLEKGQAEIDWNQTAIDIVNRIRAYNPWPVAFTQYQDFVLRIWEANSSDETSTDSPGTIIGVDGRTIKVSSKQGIVEITKLQRPGSRVVSAKEFLNGNPLQVGNLLL